MPKTLFVDNTDLTRGKRFTFATEDVVSGGSTLRVQSIIGFEQLSTSSGQVLCIGEIGNERTEIRRTSTTTSPSAYYKEVTLRDTLQFDHPQDTKIYIIDWDRVEFQHALTVGGAKSTIVAYPSNIEPDIPETTYTDSTKSSGYYFSRFNKTIDSTNSDWSDPIPYGGFDDNTVFQIKKRALDELGEEVDGKVITHEFLNQCLWEARREYHNSPGKRPFRRNFEKVIGTALTGSYRIELPTDVERPFTAENIYSVRIGTEQDMDYIDKKSWDFYYLNKPHSSLDLPYTRGTSTSIWLANGKDFSGSANINVEGTTIGLTRITGENNSFYIVTHGDWSASGGSDAWENISLGLPDQFTVFADPGGSAYIYFNTPIETAYVNQNIVADYYRTLLGYDSDADILDEPNYDMFVPYLKAKIKHRKNKGQSDITKDSDYLLWLAKKQESLSREYLATDINLEPDISHLPMPD